MNNYKIKKKNILTLQTMSRCDIVEVRHSGGEEMEKLIKKYIPMTETAFYILFSLSEPLHGYGIIKQVESLTNGRIKLGSGTIYGTLSKMHADGIIDIFSDEERKTVYERTEIGGIVLQHEMTRIEELYNNIVRFKGEKI